MTDLPAVWNALVRQALVGTERPVPPLDTAGTLDGLLGTLGLANDEDGLLAALGAMAVARRAGQVPVAAPSPPDPAPDESLPLIGTQPERDLHQMLAGRNAACLPEWLEAAAGRRVLPSLLPELLEWGIQFPDRADLVLPVLGNRGRWLARQRPEWLPFADLTMDEAWASGNTGAQLQALRRLRREDPATGRAFLEANWRAIPGEQRIRLLWAMDVNLNADDEPFLEGLLDERRRDVREHAAWRLRNLPESRLVQRMTARMEPLFSFEPPDRLHFDYPRTADPSMVRDGLPDPGKSQAECFYAMLAAVPPSHWERLWQTTPEAILGAANKSFNAGSLLQSLLDAALRFHDERWAIACLTAPASPSVADYQKFPPELVERLAAHGGYSWSDVLALFKQTDGPPGPIISNVVLQVCKEILRTGEHRHFLIGSQQGAIASLGWRLHLTVATEAETGWQPEHMAVPPHLMQQIDSCITTLRFRRRMLAALNERAEAAQ